MDFREGGKEWGWGGVGERERERKRNIDLSFYLFIHSLVDCRVCPDWGDQTHSNGVWGQCFHQLNYLARAVLFLLLLIMEQLLISGGDLGELMLNFSSRLF